MPVAVRTAPQPTPVLETPAQPIYRHYKPVHMIFLRTNVFIGVLTTNRNRAADQVTSLLFNMFMKERPVKVSYI